MSESSDYNVGTPAMGLIHQTGYKQIYSENVKFALEFIYKYSYLIEKRKHSYTFLCRETH